MSQLILIFSTLIVIFTAFKNKIHSLGVWLFVLMTHGMFVHFFGNGLQHMPLFMGLAIIPIALFDKSGFKIDFIGTSLLLLFFIIILLSCLINGGDLSSLVKIIMYLKPMFVCFVVIGCVSRREELSKLAIYIIAAAVVGGLFNIYQQIFHVQLTVNEWNQSLNRAAGLRGDPNDTAMLLLLALPLIYYKIINSRFKLQYVIFAGIVFIGIVFTGSRAGFAVIILLGIALIMHKPNSTIPRIFNFPSIKNIILVGFLVLLSLLFAPRYYWERMGTLVSGKEVGQSKSLISRGYLLKKGYKIWLNNPIIGIGPGRFHTALFGEKTITLEMRTKNAVAHNMYVEFLAELGVLGFSAFIGLSILAIRNYLQIDYLQFGENPDRYIGYGFALGLFSMLVMGFTLSQGYNSVLWFIIGASFGIKRCLQISD